MKFALALVASLAHAVKVDDLMDDLEDAVSVTLYDDMTWSVEYDDWSDYQYCDEYWNWEDCSQMWWRNACDWEAEGDCGWIYEDYWTWETFWVSCDEFNSWDSCNGNGDDYWNEYQYCDEWWNWEDCSQMYWRNACEWEAEDDCGWIYEDYYTWDTFWVSCDDYSTWDSCNGDDYWYEDEYCWNEWYYEGCSGMWWRYGCDWELEGDGWGWIYEAWNEDTWNWDTFWVSGDDYSTWDSCNGDDWDNWEDEYCDNYWYWDDCYEMWYRDACEWEFEDGTWGWIYEWYNYDTWSYEEFYVSGDEYATWESCNEDDWYTYEDETCYNEWNWEDCSQMWWRNACEWELEGDGLGWIYESYDYDTWTYDTFWVSYDEFTSWESCW